MDRKKRLAPFAPNLFPPPTFLKNPKLRDNHNFTEDALHQMTPHKKALIISDLCDKIMSACNPSTDLKYNIIDTCAGIGGNTMAFALNSKIHRIYATECDQSTFDMLHRNMNNLNGHVPIEAQKAHFDTDLLQTILAKDPAHPTGIFVDPPWGLQRPYLDLFHRSLCADSGQDNTVHAWLMKAMVMPGVAFMIIKVPKDYPWNNEVDTPPGVHMRRVSSIAKMDMLCFTHQ